MKLTPPQAIGLYVHLPWCVKKCPYCDFNSHAAAEPIDEEVYITALLGDLDFEISRFNAGRVISSIFIGGGTPSLFTAASINRLLVAIKSKFECCDDIEITLEANPGATDESRFSGYRQAGINRLSIGVQSFNNQHLQALGRIHNDEQVECAVTAAYSAGIDNLNLDLMYGLPGQTAEQASVDVSRAVALSPQHISAYHLTIEPNTLFAHKPPELPDEAESWSIQQRYHTALEQASYRRYEVSAYGKAGYFCRHNLNYWRFGDYLGIGAGAHGKITTPSGVYRTLKPKHPNRYMRRFAHETPAINEYIKSVSAVDLPLEFMMNKLRLDEGFWIEEFEQATGVNYLMIEPMLEQALARALLARHEDRFKVTATGHLFLDDLLQIFLVNNVKENQSCYG